ncbi:T9SS type A sorting domain-containing protein [Xanthovirga aplysinae]|uniref:T9SS type A sorting domain-containing protein n=1 Tax=Xanthovirga aplysinae TaxID=2529853 RepID=UPI0012BD5D8F|nr:T9SS type A sorting domain-containing protein [Xanthovirga aplysinae]MTI30434.1 T9SS type A sorting domain-containing protein [Xanthovirga aplysinae]
MEVEGATLQISDFEIYPNPGANHSTIAFEVEAEIEVALALYNAQGKGIQTLSQRSYGPGKHKLELNGKGLAPGNYILKLTKGDTFETKKITIK